jgi:hypothetical protein
MASPEAILTGPVAAERASRAIALPTSSMWMKSRRCTPDVVSKAWPARRACARDGRKRFAPSAGPWGKNSLAQAVEAPIRCGASKASHKASLQRP